MTDWWVQVTFAVNAAEVTDQARGQLAGAFKIVATDDAAGTLAVVLEVTGDPMDAWQAGYERAASALGETGITGTCTGVECLTLALHQQRALTSGVQQLLGIAGTAEAAEILGVAKQQVAKLAKTHADFPQPVDMLAAGPVYDRTEIEAWRERWPRKRTGRPAKTEG